MMLSLRIALRYLFSPKSHTAVNVISLISMAGIAVAAMAMVCVLSVFNGFRDLASDRLSAIDPDLLVTPADGRVILSADSVAAAVAGLADVRAAAPVLEQKALAISGEAQIPVTVKGVPEGYSAVTGLMSTVIDGVMADEPDSVCRERYGHSLALLSVGAAVASGARPSLERP
ncbi:MAG: ABC transporter permease, partial [Duncaniella sp.]|nr:ABC transporter permease [Duncaniella sp.]